jgi:hypothetical protein
MDLNKMLQKYTKSKKSTIPSGLTLNSGSNRGSSRFGEINEGGNNKIRSCRICAANTYPHNIKN